MRKVSVLTLIFLFSINVSSETIGLECEGKYRDDNFFYKNSIFIKIDMENETSTMCQVLSVGAIDETKTGNCKDMDSIRISDFEITGKFGKEYQYNAMFDMNVYVDAERFTVSREDLSIKFNTYFLSIFFKKNRDTDDGFRKPYEGMCELIEGEKIEDRLSEIQIINEEYLQDIQRQKESIEKREKDNKEKRLKERKL